MTPARQRAALEDEHRFGRRPSRSRAAVRRVLRAGARRCGSMSRIVLRTDEKSTYPKIASKLFGERLVHLTTPSTLARGTWNPLFPINHTEAVARDLNGTPPSRVVAGQQATVVLEPAAARLRCGAQLRSASVQPRPGDACAVAGLAAATAAVRPTPVVASRLGVRGGHPLSATAAAIGQIRSCVA